MRERSSGEEGGGKSRRREGRGEERRDKTMATWDGKQQMQSEAGRRRHGTRDEGVVGYDEAGAAQDGGRVGGGQRRQRQSESRQVETGSEVEEASE